MSFIFIANSFDSKIFLIIIPILMYVSVAYVRYTSFGTKGNLPGKNITINVFPDCLHMALLVVTRI